jgi:hypothetical protein
MPSFILLANANWLAGAVILIVSIGFFDQLIVTLFFALGLDLLPAELAGTGVGFLDGGGHLGSMWPCSTQVFWCICSVRTDLFFWQLPLWLLLDL